jgi:hypothetical protein
MTRQNPTAKRKAFCVIWVAFLSMSLFYGLAQSETKPVGFAIPFPDLTFIQLLSREE